METPGYWGESAELGLIGCILNETYPLSKAVGDVSPSHLYGSIPREILSVLIALNKVPSIPLLEQSLAEKGLIVSPLELRRIKQDAQSIDYKDILPLVQENKRKRVLSDQLDKAQKELLDPTVDSRTIANKIMVVGEKINQIDDFAKDNDKEIYDTLAEIIESRQGNNKPLMTTGHSGLDKLLGGGFEKPSLIVVGARSRVGKTAFGVWMIDQAQQRKVSCGFIGMEMSRKQLNRRELAMRSGVYYNWMKDPIGLSESQVGRLQLASDSWNQNHFARIYCNQPDIDQLRMHVSYLVNKYKCEYIVIDYLQRMNFREHKGITTAWAIGATANAIKSIAVQFNVGIILLSQLNRSNEKEQGKVREPKLTDLKESGGIEEAADAIILLHRPDIHEDNPKAENGQDLKDHIVAIVAKNRDGESDAKVFIKCNMGINMFYQESDEPLWAQSFNSTKQANEPPF